MKKLLLALLCSSALAQDFEVSLEPNVYYGGRLENAEGVTEYWDIEYWGYDEEGNRWAVTIEIKLHEAPFGPHSALSLAAEELFRRVKNKDPEVMDFLENVD